MIKRFQEFINEEFEEYKDPIDGTSEKKFIESINHFFEILDWKNSFVKKDYQGFTRKILMYQEPNKEKFLQIEITLIDKAYSIFFNCFLEQRNQTVHCSDIDNKKPNPTHVFFRAKRFLNMKLKNSGLTREFYEIQDPKNRGKYSGKRTGII